MEIGNFLKELGEAAISLVSNKPQSKLRRQEDSSRSTLEKYRNQFKAYLLLAMEELSIIQVLTKKQLIIIYDATEIQLQLTENNNSTNFG